MEWFHSLAIYLLWKAAFFSSWAVAFDSTEQPPGAEVPSWQSPSVNYKETFRPIYYATDRAIETESSNQYSIEGPIESVAIAVVALIFCGHIFIGALRKRQQFQLLLAGTNCAATSINVVAHSMGNRAFTEAVKELSDVPSSATPIFKHVFLAAPDVDSDRFRQSLAKPLRQSSQSVTIYASGKDKALALSARVHGSPRLGDSTKDVVIVEGIETIDVTVTDSTFLGHNYYSEDQRVVFDISQVMRYHRVANQRVGLVARTVGKGEYWQMSLEVANREQLKHDRR